MIKVERSCHTHHPICEIGLNLISDNYEEVQKAEKMILQMLVTNFKVSIRGFSSGWTKMDLGEGIIITPNDQGGYTSDKSICK